jgi:hypothetical protein
MPRTKSTREADPRTPIEKLDGLKSRIDHLIFFNYYDGYVTNGLIGFDPDAGPPGSTKHKKKLTILDNVTPSQFRGKGRKLSLLAKEFFDQNLVPPAERRPHFDGPIPIEELQEQEGGKKDTRTPEEKLEGISKAIDRFIFFQYYDGYTTNAEIGFSPKSGPPGSVNHKRAFTILDPVTPSAFRLKGKEMAGLVQEFIKKGTVPSADIRPQFERARPAGLLGGAAAAGY